MDVRNMQMDIMMENFPHVRPEIAPFAANAQKCCIGITEKAFETTERV